MTKKTRRRVIHKIYMRIASIERRACGMVSTDASKVLLAAAAMIANAITPEYDAKRGAGAMWLDKQLQNDSWLDEVLYNAGG